MNIWVIEEFIPSLSPEHDGPGFWVPRDDLMFHAKKDAEHYLKTSIEIIVHKHNPMRVKRYQRG